MFIVKKNLDFTSPRWLMVMANHDMTQEHCRGFEVPCSAQPVRTARAGFRQAIAISLRIAANCRLYRCGCGKIPFFRALKHQLLLLIPLGRACTLRPETDRLQEEEEELLENLCQSFSVSMGDCKTIQCVCARVCVFVVVLAGVAMILGRGMQQPQGWLRHSSTFSRTPKT